LLPQLTAPTKIQSPSLMQPPAAKPQPHLPPTPYKSNQRHDHCFPSPQLIPPTSMKKSLYSALPSFSHRRQLQPILFQITGKRRLASKMATAKEFPPDKVRAIVSEVASLLKERKESVSVAETVGQLPLAASCSLPQRSCSALHSSAR
jgi:hypothetical protein